MVKRIISKEAKNRANELHEAEHKIVDKEKPDHSASYYYFMACQLIEDLKSENIELFNMLVDTVNGMKELKDDMKEVSKQQKYLWQTLEEQSQTSENGKVKE